MSPRRPIRACRHVGPSEARPRLGTFERVPTLVPASLSPIDRPPARLRQPPPLPDPWAPGLRGSPRASDGPGTPQDTRRPHRAPEVGRCPNPWRPRSPTDDARSSAVGQHRPLAPRHGREARSTAFGEPARQRERSGLRTCHPASARTRRVRGGSASLRWPGARLDRSTGSGGTARGSCHSVPETLGYG